MANKPIKEDYKIFAIGDEGYLYNYSWYSPVKNLGEIGAIVVKLATDTLPKTLFSL